MTSQLTPNTLGGLEFSEIKKSLTAYLKTQDIFSGYEFEGSAIQTIIDMLSYNTFYYAYYANMINAEAFLDSAQKEDSVISLCKPLGYFVPSAKCATAIVSVAGTTDLGPIAAGTVFRSTNSDGVPFNFYNIEDIVINDGRTETFKIYEGTRYVDFDAIATFDLDAQVISIADTNFDINTLTVAVTNGTDAPVQWKLVSNIGYTSQINDNIYFVERTSTGFVIKFGLKNSLGKTIDESVTKIAIRYLTTNGSAANGLALFANVELGGNVSIIAESQSVGGRSKPNLDDVRLLAPKWFASQERAVTINDYKALLMDAGFFVNETEFNVFGGQDLSPPRYGRVFVTSNKDLSQTRIDEFINYVKERSVVTVLPEYVTANGVGIFVDFAFRLSGQNTNANKNKAKQLLRSIFDGNFKVTSVFGSNFSSSNYIASVEDAAATATSDKDILSSIVFSPDDFSIYIKQTLTTEKDYVFNLGNELYSPIQVRVDLTEPFDYLEDEDTDIRKVVLRILSVSNSSKNNKIQLQLWAIASDGDETQIVGDFGYCIVSKGVISIKSNVIKTSAVLNATFKSKSVVFGMNNAVTIKTDTITAL